MCHVSWVRVLKDKINIIGEQKFYLRFEMTAFAKDIPNNVWSNIEMSPLEIPLEAEFVTINFQEKLFILDAEYRNENIAVIVYCPEENRWNDHPPLLLRYR